MTTLREAAQQALEALENCTSEHGHRCNRCDSEVDEGGRVVTALRVALEQPEAQPEAHPCLPIVGTMMRHALAGDVERVRAYAGLLCDDMDKQVPGSAKYLRRVLTGDLGPKVHPASPPVQAEQAAQQGEPSDEAMPPLPELTCTTFVVPAVTEPHTLDLLGYTAEQMHAYARAVLALRTTGWIASSERMPGHRQRVIAAFRPVDQIGVWVGEAMYGGELGWLNPQTGGAYRQATHWMPLPDEPKQGDE